MAQNRGKKFEQIIREAFEKVPNVSIDRLHDQTNGFKGSQNICDFIVYKEPYEYYIECKSVHGNTLPFSNITDTQWNGLLEKSKIEGVFAGVICWWIDKDVTRFLPIQFLQTMREKLNAKSVRYDLRHDFGKMQDGKKFTATAIWCSDGVEVPLVEIPGKKRRVFFDYDMEHFFTILSIRNHEKADNNGVWWESDILIPSDNGWDNGWERHHMQEILKECLPDEIQSNR